VAQCEEDIKKRLMPLAIVIDVAGRKMAGKISRQLSRENSTTILMKPRVSGIWVRE